MQRPWSKITDRSICHLRTPALLADLDAIAENVALMSSRLEGKAAKLRPHFKNHRVLELARMQLEAGAIGLTTARLPHAAVLLQAGVPSVLMSNEIVDSTSIQFAVELAETFPEQELIAVVDRLPTLRTLAQASMKSARRLRVAIDIDLGLGRTGTDPEQGYILAKEAVALGLPLKGLFAYEGHLQKIQPDTERRRLCLDALGKLSGLARRLRADGLPIEMVSSSGTGSTASAVEIEGITEIQAGSYLLMEKGYEAAAPGFKTAITVLATVISKTDRQRVVLDAGMKALSCERGMPTLKDAPGLHLRALHAEHGICDFMDSEAPVEVGDLVQIWVQYGDATVNLHREMFGVRSDRVETQFEILAN